MYRSAVKFCGRQPQPHASALTVNMCSPVRHAPTIMALKYFTTLYKHYPSKKLVESTDVKLSFKILSNFDCFNVNEKVPANVDDN